MLGIVVAGRAPMKQAVSYTALCFGLLCACGACGGRTSSDQLGLDASPDASAEANPQELDASEGGIGVALTIPLGQYTGCTASTVNIGGNVEATGGGDGTVTLSTDGDGGVYAALSFAPYVSGTVAFAPTSSATAALTAGPFDVQTLDTNNASATVGAK